MRIICKDNENCHVIATVKKYGVSYFAVMTKITEKEEEKLNNGELINVIYDIVYDLNHKTNLKIQISAEDCYLYGDIDFEDENCINELLAYNFIDNEFHGAFIPKKYDYRNHSTVLVNNKLAWVETYDVMNLYKYAHACIGKPNRVAIFNIPITTIQSKVYE